MITSLLLLLSYATIACMGASVVQVDEASQHFVAPDGRVLVMHGVNVVYKVPPFIPSTTVCNAMTSLCPEDIDWLVSNGFNGVRLGLMWEALMPKPGWINETYLGEVKGLVNMLADAGIYTIIDAHQDVYARRFCGEGFPDWTVETNVTAEGLFPFPLNASLEFDGTGKDRVPTIASCVKNGFQTWLFALEVNEAWESLYDVATGLQTFLQTHWSRVAKEFANASEYVLGYELLNEPFVGNVYKDPLLVLEAGLAEKINLMPLYERLNSVIRETDQDRIIFYEPVIIGPYFGHHTGFSAGPGGPSSNHKQAFSEHLYCFNFSTTGDIVNETKCNDTMATVWEIMQNDSAKLGGGRILTEFGAVGPDQTSADSLTQIMDYAEGAQMSAFYWPFKSFHDITTNNASTEGLFYPNGTVQELKYRALARPYPQKTPAQPSSFHWQYHSDGTLAVSYTTNPSASNQTAVFFAPSFVYGPAGPTVDLQPPSSGTVRKQGQFVAIDHVAGAATSVSVRLSVAA